MIDATVDAAGVYGPLSVLAGAPSGTVTSPSGGSAVGGGDINGDGYDDLIIAAEDDSGTVNGAVFGTETARPRAVDSASPQMTPTQPSGARVTAMRSPPPSSPTTSMGTVWTT